MRLVPSRTLPGLLLVLASACEPRLYTEGGPVADAAWTPPENSWPVGAPPEDLRPEGMGVGRVVYDVRGLDQHGDELSLWQFHGSWVLLDVSTMWCAPCRDLAIGTEALWQEYRDRGLVTVTLLLEDTHGDPPKVADLKQWATLASLDPEHDYELITAPVVSDPKGRSGSIEAIERGQYPALLLISPDLQVTRRIEPVTDVRVREVLAELDL
ncbi:MAG: redoxin domain-containing protein [Alphaproteobacteria bacterium]|nr:redoxin domain-containing protein [Alphaproteobacteria bacterium]